MTIDEKFVDAVNNIVKTFGSGEYIITKRELITLLGTKYEVVEGSVIPSDYCYNIINEGIKNQPNKPKLFEYLSRGKYRCLGENYPYNGKVYHKNKIVGECINGDRKPF